MLTVAGWEQWGWLAAGFSTRRGGVSAVYGGSSEREAEGELNLGFTAEDEAARVRENRRRLVAGVAGGPWELVTLHQVHGVAVREVGRATVGDAMRDGRACWQADGLVTRDAGVLLGVGAADCVPVLLADVRQRAVGGFHAGWRGTAAGMVLRGVEQMRASFGTRAEDCVAAIGPSIGRCCYEVDEAVREGFAAGPAAGDVAEICAEGAVPGRYWLDLWTANRLQLERAGVPAASIRVVGECAACTRDGDGGRRYFSHRSEGGRTGRMLGVIGVRA